MAKDQCGGAQELRREREIARLRLLWERQPKSETEFSFQGVLLSDAIEECVTSFGLITPFKPENLKSASYKLTVGDEYALDGKLVSLVDESGRNTITIPPFAVAIVKTRETINMPRFLIGRWNIQVSKAYEGLVWVGGPQVDPGYVGHLFCPIYNLRDKPVELIMGKPIAVIDFVRTSEIHSNSKRYNFPPDNILFEDYKPDTLISGIAESYKQVKQNNDAVKKQLELLAARIDNFVLITFTVIAVLFAAVTIFVARTEQPSWWNPVLFLISGTALFMSGVVWVRTRDDDRWFGRIVQLVVVAFLIAATVLQLRLSNPLQIQIDGLKKQIEQLQQQQQSKPVATVPAAAAKPSETPPPQAAAEKQNQGEKRQ
jgi:deoxycytidine triphosphate deaminase